MKIPYKIYDKKEINAQIEDGERAIYVSEGIYKCMLVINPMWADYRKIDNSIVGHFDFFALSDGWQKYTNTGYHSTFFMHLDIEQYSSDNFVIESFKTSLKDTDFIFENSIQTSLF